MFGMVVRRVLIALCSKSATILGLGFLALFVQVASAQGPLNYFQNYFVTGDYVVGGVGGLSTQGPNPTATIPPISVPCTSGPGLLASVVPCTAKGAVPADIIAAFLYWETIEPTSSTTPTATAGTFDANLTSGLNINPEPTVPMSGLALGSPQIPACVAGGGTESTKSYMRVYRADVLRFLNINSTAGVRTANYTHTITFTGNALATPTTPATQFLGATLVVVYRLVAAGTPRIAPLRSVVIYDGAFTGVASSKSPSLNQTIGGFYEASSSPNAKMTHIVGGGQTGFKETLTVNGSIPAGVPANPFVGAEGADWDSYTFNYNLASSASSVQTEVQSSNDCLSWGAIITSTNVQDSDFDGLLDVWETSGLYFNPGVRNDGMTTPPPTPASFGTCTGNAATCVNFKAMGALPNVPDIFIQIDWMESTPPYALPSVPNHNHMPQYGALNMVGAVFQSHGINMHFDVGNNYQGQPYIIPHLDQNGNVIAQGGNPIQESSVLCEPNPSANPPLTCNFSSQSQEYSVLSWKTGFSAIKNGDSSFPSPPGPLSGLPQLFPTNRKDSFHYALFAHAIAATTPLSAPEAGSISGVADLPGGDLMVTLGLWRSDVSAVDQVGTVLEQAGTLMHELGHNLHLHHGGWNNTPVCMPNYPSVMNYLYQVAGLTDSSGVEHLDYSYGLYLPMAEDLLSSAIPMGIQNYKVRYFGPYNGAIDTPGQASKVFCSGNLLTGSEGSYVLLQGPTVSTPDWSNGTVKLGAVITKGLDINYDGTEGEIFIDSPDWLSLNLQQVSARAGADGISADLGKGDQGAGDLGKGDQGKGDQGTPDLGKGDQGTAALGADALGDQNYAAFVGSGGLPAPSGLTVAVYVPPASTAGGTGNILNWTGNTGVAAQYNIYRCNASVSASCTPTLLTSTSSTSTSGTPPVTVVTPTYTDLVNDFTDAGSNANCNTSTCYNTNYNYYVTEVNTSTPGVTCTLTTCQEGAGSNTGSSEVYHAFVIANSQPTVTYGATTLPFPAPTYTAYGSAVYSTTTSGATASGSTTVVMASATNLAAGQAVGGAGIAANTTVVSISSKTVTLSLATVAAIPTNTTITFSASSPPVYSTTTSASTASGSITVVVASGTSLAAGQAVAGAGIAANTTVASISSTTVTLSLPTGAAIPSGTSITFTNPGQQLSGVTCSYAGALSTYSGQQTPRNAGPYTISCSGPLTVPGSPTIGVTYNAAYLTETPARATLTISALAITVTATQTSKQYDGTPNSTALPSVTPTSAFPYTFPPYGDTKSFTESYDSSNVTSPTNNHTMTPAGTMMDYVSGLSSANYTVSNPTSGSLGPPNGSTITPAPLTITATANTKTYDGTPSAAAIPTTSVPCGVTTVTGPLKLCGTDTVTNLTETYNTPNAGTGLTLTVSPGYTISDNNGGNNYTVSLKTNTTGVINPAPVTATAGSYSGTYDGATHSPTPACTVTPTTLAVSTFIGTVTCTNNPASVGPNVGSGTVTPTNTVGANDSLSNYAITSVNGSWTISPAPVTATAGGYSGTYNGAAQSPSGCLVTPNAPNTYTGSLTCANNPTSVGPNVGSGTVTPAPAVGANNSLSNYAITSVGGTWKINPAPVTATAGSLTANYNGASQSPSGCTVTAILPNTYTGTLTCTNNPMSVGPNVGSGTVTPVSAAGANDSLSNYAVTPGNGTWIINQAPSTVTDTVTDSAPTPTAPDYGQPVTFTVTVAPPASGEVPTGTVTFSFTLNSGATTYYICSGGTISMTQCPVALSSSSPYTASVMTSTLPTAAENVVATYSGDTNFLGEPANDNPVSVTVSQASSAVTLTKSANPTTYGSPVSLTVNVADATNGSIGVPTGTVTLSFVLDPTVQNGQMYYICADGSVITAPCASLNQITLGADPTNPTTVTVPNIALPAGLATFANSTANPTPYSYPINATYSGDTNFAAGSPIGLSQTVNPLPVTATAGSLTGTYNGASQSPSGCVVTPISPNTSTGTLTCTNNPNSVGPPAGSGTVTPVPSVGAGDSLNNYAITLVNGSWNIAKASTTTSISSVTPSPTDPTVPTTVTVMVAPVAPGTGTPTGSVTVNASPAGVSCTIASFSAPTGSCALTFAAGGGQSLTATYTSNSSNFSNSATSAATPLTVNQPVTIGPSSLPPATLNFPYQPQQLMASGGSGSYTNYAVTGGSLPIGLTLSSSGLLSGTPTAAGSNPVTVSVTDTLGDVIPQNYTISIGFTLVGTAAVNGAGIQLTSTTGQAGAAWAGTQQSVTSGFSTTFQFQITADAANNTLADGLAFVIQADTRGASALGGDGGDIGYAGTTTGITNSLAVEFDTYDDSGAPEDDPNGNHIAIISNGTSANLASHCQTSPGPCSGGSSLLAVTNSSLAFTLADGAPHTVTVAYTGGSSGTLTVSVGTTTIVTATNLNLETLLGLPSNGMAWVGFTGGSGAGGENGDISNWSFSAGQ
jgi:hypothetical protein